MAKDNCSTFRGLSFASKNFGSDFENWPNVLKDLRNDQSKYNLAWQAFAMLILYL
jgi:hypothetical protein